MAVGDPGEELVEGVLVAGLLGAHDAVPGEAGVHGGVEDDAVGVLGVAGGVGGAEVGAVGQAHDGDLLAVEGLLALLGCTGFLWREVEEHLLSFERRHVLYLAEFLKVVGETKQKHLSLLFEQDGASAEEDVGANLVAVLEKLLRVLELELVVVLVGLWSEPYFLHFHLHLLGLHLLGAFFLLVEEL